MLLTAMRCNVLLRATNKHTAYIRDASSFEVVMLRVLSYMHDAHYFSWFLHIRPHRGTLSSPEPRQNEAPIFFENDADILFYIILSAPCLARHC